MEIIRLKRELRSTSSQDEFAKWATLRRLHDKAVAEYAQQGMNQATEFGFFLGGFFGMGLITLRALGQLGPFNPTGVHLTKQ